MTTTRCGTYAEYQAHVRRGEEPCSDCRAANREYVREYRTSPSVRLRQMRRETARQRALVRLARMHPSQYDAIYAEEWAQMQEDRP